MILAFKLSNLITVPFGWLLGQLYQLTSNYGLAMIIFGILGQLVLLPNKTLADSKMINYSVMGRRRVTQRISASYDAPTETVKAACEKALAMTDLILTDPAPEAHLSSYGDSAIEYVVFCWAKTADYWTVHFNLGENLRKTFAEFGVEMTYNHLNVHVLNEKQN